MNFKIMGETAKPFTVGIYPTLKSTTSRKNYPILVKSANTQNIKTMIGMTVGFVAMNTLSVIGKIALLAVEKVAVTKIMPTVCVMV